MKSDHPCPDCGSVMHVSVGGMRAMVVRGVRVILPDEMMFDRVLQLRREAADG